MNVFAQILLFIFGSIAIAALHTAGIVEIDFPLTWLDDHFLRDPATTVGALMLAFSLPPRLGMAETAC